MIVSASKAPFTYAPVTFRVQDDIGLYIASPPHATQGISEGAVRVAVPATHVKVGR